MGLSLIWRSWPASWHPPRDDGDWVWWKAHPYTYPLWETWFCQSLGVLIPDFLVNPWQCPCRQFNFDPYGDHIQTCQCQSTELPTNEWITYNLSLLLRSVGHRVKDHKITPADVNERGDIEIRDYVILPHGEDDRLPPHTLVMDVTMSHDLYGRTTQRTNLWHITHTQSVLHRCSSVWRCLEQYSQDKDTVLLSDIRG
jgi:hypothetical protein